MHLEHLNLVVKDIPSSLRFYRAVFPHWKIRQEGQSDWHGVKRKWIHFGDDYNYLTFNDNGVGENRDLSTNNLGMAHFAYITNNIEDIVIRLKNAGYLASKSGPDNQYRRNVYFIDPNGYEVEFVQYLSDMPNERNSNE